jgi:hypothetical protein
MCSASTRAPRSGDAASRWWSFGRRQSAALAVATVAIFVWFGRDLPRVPWLTSDSESYLEFSPVRPHGYSLFLAAYRLGFEDLAHLPSVQLALYLAAVFLLAAAVGRRARSLPAAAATLFLVCGLTDTSHFCWVLSDPIYAVALTAATACFVLYAENRRISLLALASAGLGAALVIRPIGLALLPGFLIAVFAHGRSLHRSLQLVGLAVLPVVLLYCGAASSQLMHNGRFALGTWGGMDVLGKLPLLSRLLPEDDPVSRLNSIIEAMEPAREKLRRANDPILEALLARQYYDHLRWSVVTPDFERTWAAWRDGDEYERGHLAAELATAYAGADPIGLLRRTAIDFVGLWVMPRWLTEGEHDALLTRLQSMGELPFLTAFAHTPEGKLDYHKIVPAPAERASVFIFRTAVFTFWAFSLVFAALLASRHRSKIFLSAPDLFFMVVGVHSIYFGTAIMEGTYERYIMPTWPLLVSCPILGLALTFRRRREQSHPARFGDFAGGAP